MCSIREDFLPELDIEINSGRSGSFSGESHSSNVLWLAPPLNMLLGKNQSREASDEQSLHSQESRPSTERRTSLIVTDPINEERKEPEEIEAHQTNVEAFGDFPHLISVRRMETVDSSMENIGTLNQTL